MIDTLYIVYTALAAAAVALLLAGRAAGMLRARRRANDLATLGQRYLRLTMLALEGEDSVPRFPELSRPGARLLLARTLSGVLAATYGLDAGPLRRIVRAYDLDGWLLRRARRARGYDRARYLALLAMLPVAPRTVRQTERYLRSSHRAVAFQALMIRITAQPETALRAMAAYPRAFTAAEVARILAELRRGVLPIAYEPLLRAPQSNLRRVGLGIVREFAVEEAEPYLLRLVAEESSEELACEALHALCLLRRPLDGRGVSERVASMERAGRRALLRRMAREAYGAGALRPLLDASERPYYESLVASYKCALA